MYVCMEGKCLWYAHLQLLLKCSYLFLYSTAASAIYSTKIQYLISAQFHVRPTIYKARPISINKRMSLNKSTHIFIFLAKFLWDDLSISHIRHWPVVAEQPALKSTHIHYASHHLFSIIINKTKQRRFPHDSWSVQSISVCSTCCI